MTSKKKCEDRYIRIERECGCTLTENNEYSPCKPHWQLIHDMSMVKSLTGGEIDPKLSLEYGVPIVKSSPPTWMSPKRFEELTKDDS